MKQHITITAMNGAIFKLKKAFDDQFGLPGTPRNVENQLERVHAEQSLNAQLRALWGDQRFTEHERSQDNAYRALVQLGQQQDLPNNTVLEAYAMKNAAEEKAGLLCRDETLLNEQRQAALVSIRAEMCLRGIREYGKMADQLDCRLHAYH